MKEKVLFLPGLNGLRTIVSLSVMISHIALSASSFNLDYYTYLVWKIMAWQKHGFWGLMA
jgi:hypothetical protein